MSCSGRNRESTSQDPFESWGEASGEMADFYQYQNTQNAQDIHKFNKWMDRANTVGDLTEDQTYYGIGKVYAGYIGYATGSAAAAVAAIYALGFTGLVLGPVLTGVIIGAAAVAGGYLLREYYLDEWDPFYQDITGDMSHATNGSDPRTTGPDCDDDNPYDYGNDSLGDSFEFPTTSPLVLDMDGDGIELISLDRSNAMFDLNADGFVESTGWVGSDDALLARDVNANGKIDDINELFGDATQDGFLDLASNDANSDGHINQQDAVYSNLLIWRDANEDGVSQAGELQTLAEAGITSINLAATSNEEVVEGNRVSTVSTFVRDGATYSIKDVWFTHNPSSSFYKLDPNFAFNEDVFQLPQLRGFGTAKDLWVAMSEDSGLLDMVATLSTADYSVFSYEEFYADVQAIMWRWLGTDSASIDGRGEFIDGRTMEAIEEWIGQEFTAFNSSDPNEYVAALLQDQWKDLVDGVAARLLTQIPTLPLLSAIRDAADLYNTSVANGVNFDTMTDTEAYAMLHPIFDSANAAMGAHPLRHLAAVEYDFITNEFVGSLESLVDAVIQSEPGNSGLKETHWNNYLPVINAFAKAMEVTSAEYEAALTGTYLEASTTIGPLLQHRYDRVEIGSSVRDVIDYSGEPEGNYSKFLVGGGGDDRIHGAYGANAFFYNLGDGKDSYRVWNQDNQSDRVIFGPDVALGNITSVTQSTDSIRINLSDGGEIFLENQLESKLGGIEYFEFWDGTVYNSPELMALVRGVDYSTNPSDVIYAVNAGGLPHSTGGKAYQEDAPYLTTIYVSVRNQTGTAIANTTDDDIYRSQRYDTENFGYDLHLENGTYEITLKFAELVWNAAGARKFDVKMEGILVEDDLDVFSLAGGKNAALDRVHYVTITDENLDLDLLLGSVDNPMISGFVIRSVASAPTIAGTSSGNSLAGTPGSELIQGLEGNDTLIGGLGHDTLDGGAGRDTLTGGAGEDIFRFSALTHSQGAVGSDPAIYDRITDFENHIDKFDLTGLGFVRFITSGTTQAGELRAAYSSTSDRTYVKSDQLPFSFYLDGNRLADLDGSDFLLDPSAGNLIYGTLSADNLTGTSLDDKVLGLLGDDSINGGLGSDTINGSVGEDRLTGGSGADVFKFTGLTHSVGTGGFYDRIVDFQDGIDRIDVSDLGFTGLVSGATSVGQLRFTVNSGGTRTYVHSDQSDFEFFLDGNWGSTLSAADFIFYTAPSGGINGTATTDTLSGTSANETLRGLGGDDTLSGGSGNDTLNGGADKDRLTGGAGADLFQFTDRTHSLHTGGFYDRIVDFEDGIDKIDLSGLGFTTLTTSTPQIDQLRLSYSSASNRTYVKNDPSDFSFFLDGDWVSNGLLTNADFIFA